MKVNVVCYYTLINVSTKCFIDGCAEVTKHTMQGRSAAGRPLLRFLGKTVGSVYHQRCLGKVKISPRTCKMVSRKQTKMVWLSFRDIGFVLYVRYDTEWQRTNNQADRLILLLLRWLFSICTLQCYTQVHAHSFLTTEHYLQSYCSCVYLTIFSRLTQLL